MAAHCKKTLSPPWYGPVTVTAASKRKWSPTRSHFVLVDLMSMRSNGGVFDGSAAGFSYLLPGLWEASQLEIQRSAFISASTSSRSRSSAATMVQNADTRPLLERFSHLAATLLREWFAMGPRSRTGLPHAGWRGPRRPCLAGYWHRRYEKSWSIQGHGDFARTSVSSSSFWQECSRISNSLHCLRAIG